MTTGWRAFTVVAAMAIPSLAAGQRNIPTYEAIDRTVRAQVDSGFRGVVLVAWQDSVILNRSYAALTEGMRPTDVFWIASMTKSFTAMAVLHLRELGLLSLTDSIGRFFPDAPADKRGITIHQLLTHTAGLGGEYSGGGIANRSDAVQAILAPALIFAPGQGYKYGDDDYELLAAIIEIASGQQWEDFVQVRVLAPLHLLNTGFACGINNKMPSHLTCDWGRKGANGMFSSAPDLLKWSRWLLTDSAITRPQVLVRKEPPWDVSYGYGVRIYTVNGTTVEVMHSGSGDNDHTSIVRNMSSGLTVIVLSNAGQHGDMTWASYLARQLATRDNGASTAMEAIRREIRQATRNYSGLIVAMDHAAIAAMYTKDGEMSAEGEPTIRGPDAIRAHLETFKDFHVLSEILTTDSISVEGNTARVVGTYHQRVRVPAGDTVMAAGEYMADWLRDPAGQWRVRRMTTAPRP